MIMDLWNYVLGMYECYTNNKFISITLSLISLYVAVTSVIHYYKYKLEGYQRDSCSEYIKVIRYADQILRDDLQHTRRGNQLP